MAFFFYNDVSHGPHYQRDLAVLGDDSSDGNTFSDEKRETYCGDVIDFSKKERGIYVFQGNGRDFLSALWRGLQQGTTGARDIQMKFKDGKEMCISSTVLSNVAQYFQVMLDCGLRETQENKVTLPTVTQSTFTRLMAFTLGQRVEMKTREELMELLEAAEMMQMQSLVDACIELLQAKATASNCLETFLMIRRLRPSKIHTAASSVAAHMKSVRETDEWCRLEEEDITLLLGTWATFFRSVDYTEVFYAVLRWIKTNGADQDTSTRLLDLIDSDKILDLHANLPDQPVLMKSTSVMKAVQKWLELDGEITLLVVGSAESKGDDCTDSYIYCWSEIRRDWYVFPPPPEKLPKDFAVTKSGNALIISGGISRKTGPSDKVWTVDESGWKEVQRLVTARSRHGMAAIDDDLYFVGGLPGPLNSVEMRRKAYEFYGIAEEVGILPEAVYDCGVAAVKERLIVVGGYSSEGPRNIIQTFHTFSRAAEVITLPESPGQQLDLRFTRYVGTLDSLLFLSRSGHLLEVKLECRTVTLQGQVLLKDFHHQAPFAAVLDSGGVVVCDSRSADCKYSLDGEKKEETTIVRRLRDDMHVHSVFRFFLRYPSVDPPKTQSLPLHGGGRQGEETPGGLLSSDQQGPW